jgi:hypothetical protein
MWRRVWIVALAIAAFIWGVMVIGFIYDLATHRHEPSSDVALILISIVFVWVSVRGYEGIVPPCHETEWVSQRIYCLCGV